MSNSFSPICLCLKIWAHERNNLNSLHWWGTNNLYCWSCESKACVLNWRIMQHNHQRLGFVLLTVANIILFLRPCPPRNTFSQRSFISSPLTWCHMLLYFGFRGLHYLILNALFFWNVFTIDDPTIKVSMPFSKTYFLLSCPWTNHSGIWN